MSYLIQCLSVRQPWAWALVSGHKDVENRSWSTNYRGRIVIHAGANKSVVNQVSRSGGTPLPRVEFEYGALIGIIDVLDVQPLDEPLESNPWAWGPYCWKVGNARRFLKPILAKGKLKLFSLDPPLAQQATAAMASAERVRRDSVSEAWIAAITQLDDERSRHGGLLNSYFDLADARNSLRLSEFSVSRWGDEECFLERGLAKVYNDDSKGALDDINRAIQMAPSARAYMMRSRVFESLDDEHSAERDRKKAQELDPEYFNVATRAETDDE